ncbi:MAG: hypothetical protein IIA41_13880 [SAR324 cluster bacterium]|nr:hypothetical protein [SAR324 cluster bacterium]
MKIFGVDFTSAPGAAKPIAWAEGALRGDLLEVAAVHELTSLEAFRERLAAPGPWVAGLDFPFGLPNELVDGLARRRGWPRDWAGYVGRANDLSRREWARLMRGEAARGATGERYRFRPADRLARAASPMNVVNPPVGKMFHAGAPILLEGTDWAVAVKLRDLAHADILQHLGEPDLVLEVPRI